MAETPRETATTGREDFSRFVVHLTRDDSETFNNGSPARENFLKILKSRKIHAYRPHCIFSRRLNDLSKTSRGKLKVACFTEVPLNQLHLLTRPIEGREIEFEPYGFVFTKEFIAAAGGQPAIYINSYSRNSWLREGVEELFSQAHNGGKFENTLWRILPFLNAMHERYDFSWEREWRVLNKLEFKHDDLVCVILPDEGEDEIKETLANAGVAVISPGWSYEHIVSQLATQQRMTKRLILDQQIKAPAIKEERE